MCVRSSKSGLLSELERTRVPAPAVDSLHSGAERKYGQLRRRRRNDERSGKRGKANYALLSPMTRRCQKRMPKNASTAITAMAIPANSP